MSFYLFVIVNAVSKDGGVNICAGDGVSRCGNYTKRGGADGNDYD